MRKSYFIFTEGESRTNDCSQTNHSPDSLDNEVVDSEGIDSYDSLDNEVLDSERSQTIHSLSDEVFDSETNMGRSEVVIADVYTVSYAGQVKALDDHSNHTIDSPEHKLQNREVQNNIYYTDDQQDADSKELHSEGHVGGDTVAGGLVLLTTEQPLSDEFDEDSLCEAHPVKQLVQNIADNPEVYSDDGEEIGYRTGEDYIDLVVPVKAAVVDSDNTCNQQDRQPNDGHGITQDNETMDTYKEPDDGHGTTVDDETVDETMDTNKEQPNDGHGITQDNETVDSNKKQPYDGHGTTQIDKKMDRNREPDGGHGITWDDETVDRNKELCDDDHGITWDGETMDSNKKQPYDGHTTKGETIGEDALREDHKEPSDVEVIHNKSTEIRKDMKTSEPVDSLFILKYDSEEYSAQDIRTTPDMDGGIIEEESDAVLLVHEAFKETLQGVRLDREVADNRGEKNITEEDSESDGESKTMQQKMKSYLIRIGIMKGKKKRNKSTRLSGSMCGEDGEEGAKEDEYEGVEERVTGEKDTEYNSDSLLGSPARVSQHNKNNDDIDKNATETTHLDRQAGGLVVQQGEGQMVESTGDEKDRLLVLSGVTTAPTTDHLVSEESTAPTADHLVPGESGVPTTDDQEETVGTRCGRKLHHRGLGGLGEQEVVGIEAVKQADDYFDHTAHSLENEPQTKGEKPLYTLDEPEHEVKIHLEIHTDTDEVLIAKEQPTNVSSEVPQAVGNTPDSSCSDKYSIDPLFILKYDSEDPLVQNISTTDTEDDSIKKENEAVALAHEAFQESLEGVRMDKDHAEPSYENRDVKDSEEGSKSDEEPTTMGQKVRCYLVKLGIMSGKRKRRKKTGLFGSVSEEDAKDEDEQEEHADGEGGQELIEGEKETENGSHGLLQTPAGMGQNNNISDYVEDATTETLFTEEHHVSIGEGQNEFRDDLDQVFRNGTQYSLTYGEANSLQGVETTTDESRHGFGNTVDETQDGIGKTTDESQDGIRKTTDEAKDGIGKTTNEAKDGLGKTTDEAGDGIGETTDEAGDGIGKTTDEVQDGIGETTDEAGDGIGKTTDEAGDGLESTDESQCGIGKTIDESQYGIGKTTDDSECGIGKTTDESQGGYGKTTDETQDGIGKTSDESQGDRGKNSDESQGGLGKTTDESQDGLGKTTDETQDGLGKTTDETQNGIGKTTDETQDDIGKTTDEIQNGIGNTADVSQGGIDSHRILVEVNQYGLYAAENEMPEQIDRVSESSEDGVGMFVEDCLSINWEKEGDLRSDEISTDEVHTGIGRLGVDSSQDGHERDQDKMDVCVGFVGLATATCHSKYSEDDRDESEEGLQKTGLIHNDTVTSDQNQNSSDKHDISGKSDKHDIFEKADQQKVGEDHDHRHDSLEELCGHVEPHHRTLETESQDDSDGKRKGEADGSGDVVGEHDGVVQTSSVIETTAVIVDTGSTDRIAGSTHNNNICERTSQDDLALCGASLNSGDDLALCGASLNSDDDIAQYRASLSCSGDDLVLCEASLNPGDDLATCKASLSSGDNLVPCEASLSSGDDLALCEASLSSGDDLALYGASLSSGDDLTLYGASLSSGDDLTLYGASLSSGDDLALYGASLSSGDDLTLYGASLSSGEDLAPCEASLSSNDDLTLYGASLSSGDDLAPCEASLSSGDESELEYVDDSGIIMEEAIDSGSEMDCMDDAGILLDDDTEFGDLAASVEDRGSEVGDDDEAEGSIFHGEQEHTQVTMETGLLVMVSSSKQHVQWTSEFVESGMSFVLISHTYR